ncbi:hypothetical protein [Cryptosporangium aurantiacum]|uniref:Uncharacterized protein n=1 Tax=Cryptosporangium aurantiacum TaxID=134849 RepID=A0A1M7RL77_9ACTN|nr:hypothetical protein [Cryptosporangium aurantiacum]SHN46901.1 hypothetical protein SAMN05443668_118134 [Cryptosporangium aurantiacum]
MRQAGQDLIPGGALHRLRTASPRRRRAQLGGLIALCALATGSTGALLAVANAGVDLVRIRPVEPGPSSPPRAEGLPAGQAGSVTPTREPAFGWSEREARRPYVARSPRSRPTLVRASPSTTATARALSDDWVEPFESFEFSGDKSFRAAPTPGESGAATSRPAPASPGEGSARPDETAPDSAGPTERPPAVGVVSARPTPSESPLPTSLTELEIPPG